MGRKVRKNDKKKRKKNLREKLLCTTKEYALSTTIHGFSYIADSGHSKTGRIIWTILVTLAITLTTYQIVSLRNQWESNPVITPLDTISFPIKQIAFPAVTICPQGSVREVTENILFNQLKNYIQNKTRKEPARRKRFAFETKIETSESNEDIFWNITYEEMMEMSSLGAKVLQTRAVELAMNYNVRIQVRSAFIDSPGTFLVSEDEIVEQQEKNHMLS